MEIGLGGRVMLTSNLSVEAGLANGSIGIVEQVIELLGDDGNPKDDNNPINSHNPDIILVRFPNYTGKTFSPNDSTLVPIFRHTCTYKAGTRSQFPLTGASALTVHKSQGLTLDSVYIDLGSSEFTVGLTFVALSRVKKWEILFLKPITEERYKEIGKDCIARREMNFLQTVQNTFQDISDPV